MKKYLLLALLVLLPLLANAEAVEIDGIRYNLVSKAKQAEVTSGGKYSGSITIPSMVTYEGVDYSVTSIGGSAFYDCGGLTAITIPENVTSIGSSAFYYCTSLTAITLPEGVTSIGISAFSYCSSLTAITLPESVTSIGNEAFYGCNSLTAITIPEGSQLTHIGEWAFWHCNSLKSITIPEGVTSIGNYAFMDCSSLAAITHPEGSQLTSIGGRAFSDCSSLTTINIPENVTSIGNYAFYGCSSLTAITLPEGVTSIGNHAFDACTSLTAITLPEGVESIGEGAFQYCSSLTAIVLKRQMYIGSKAFANCSELLGVYCYAVSVPWAEANAFEGSYPEYVTLHVPDNAMESYKTTTPWSSFGKIVALGAAITDITLNQSSATLCENESLKLAFTVTPSEADMNLISWSSSNPSVATVDNTGKVTAVAPGTATITAKANDGSGMSASCEVTVVPASYVVTYLVDGEVFATDTLARGESIEVIAEPVKEGYTFSGWSEIPAIMPANDITIEGTFVVNKYLVTFKIGDEVISSESLDYGAAIVAPDAPEKEGYTFNGWGDVAETVPAGDVTYEGSYTINKYLVTFKIGDEVISSASLDYGAAIVAPDAPMKEGYTFNGWGDVAETVPAGDVTYEGSYTVNKYLVTFMMGDEVISSESLDYGAAIVAPDAPMKEGYTFSGWGDVAETVPAGDVTYEGSYTVNIYNVYYYVGDELVHTAEVAYGDIIPEYVYEPTEEGYTFLGWVGEFYDTMPAYDVTYTANIDNGIKISPLDPQRSTIYDIHGRHVLNTDNLKGGIYIVNGRKLIIR